MQVGARSLLYLLTIIILISVSHAANEHFVTTELQTNWVMSILDGPPQTNNLKSKVYNTSIPTVLHLDLLKNGDIPDPFLKDNYPGVKWVSECTAQYSTKFIVDPKVFSEMNHHQLVFEGIDTYAEIKLNGVEIQRTENAFRKYVIDVKSALKEGSNDLVVRIESTIKHDNAGNAANAMPFVYAHTRKACYQYSWDWAPYLNTLGIWKKVYLESFKEVKIDYIWARTRYISKQKATINFAVALNFTEALEGKYKIGIFYNKTQLASFPVSEKYTYHDVDIKNPQLWWPNGIGKPFVYDFEVQLFVDGPQQNKIDERLIPFGIRTVQLDQNSNKFTVKVNGYPVYCKGANYVPPDMFYPRLENPQYTPGNTIENLINDAADSNFNMIRLWGGGQYESDKFFELASRKGIMIFYDFMFSDSIYPSTEKFLLNVEEEIKQQIRRVRNYPCLTLWSGNNQILQGIHDWGWGRDNYRTDYHRLFEILIPKVIEFESPYIPYIPSSPVLGVGNYGFQRGGDVHYWGVWAAGANFESYKGAVGNFNSEFGTQALPVWQTICQTVGESDRKYQSPVLLLHERHNSQFNTLKNYMNTYMKGSRNFELQTYQSGLLQAFAVEIAIKAQRISKPKSWGTLYWQFNDAWPGISWSSIDYFGRWKPLQFMAKRLYPDVAIFSTQGKISVLNDKLYEVQALAIIEIFHFQGQVLYKEQKQIKLGANEVQAIFTAMDSHYKGKPKSEIVIYVEIVAGKTSVMTSTEFLQVFKNLNLPSATVTVEYNTEFNQITLSTDKVVKNLFISNTEKYAKFSNNYFDLVPGHSVKVVLQGGSLADLKGTMKFRGYKQVYSDQELKIIYK